MKKADLECAINDLEDLRAIAAKQDYNTSIEINQKLIKVLPLLQTELSKMNRNNFDVTSPIYLEITQRDCEDTHQSMQEYINNSLENLSDNEIDIIDFGIHYIDDKTKVGYIKYDRR